MKLFNQFVAMLCLALAFFASAALAQDKGEPQDSAKANASQQPKSYHLLLNYADKEVSLKEIKLTDLPAPLRAIQPIIGWRCVIVGEGNATLDSFKFDIPATTCTDKPAEDDSLSGGCISKDKSYFLLEAPYYENGIGIILWRPDGKNYYINTIGFAKLCGDNICESNENYANCAKDCRSGVKDGYCDGISDGTCDPDCAIQDAAPDSDCKTSSGTNAALAWWIVAGLLVILGAGWIMRHKKQSI